MAYNALDDICKCDIDISNPSSSDATYHTILLLTDTKDSAETWSAPVKISKSSEILTLGYTEDSDAYKALTVIFGQRPSPQYVYVIAKNTDDEGTVSDLLEKCVSCGFYGIYSTNDSYSAACAAWAEENERLCGYDYSGTNSLEDKDYFRTFVMYGEKYSALALMAKCFGYAAGSETWHCKELSGVDPIDATHDKYAELAAKYINTYRTIAGKDVSYGGYTLSGEWIDTVRLRDYIKSEIQRNVFDAFRANTKIPYTDAGINLIVNQIESVLKDCQLTGGIAPDEENDDGSINAGYTITAPRASELTEAERKSRKLTGVNWSARLAGAIHMVEIGGYLTY